MRWIGGNINEKSMQKSNKKIRWFCLNVFLMIRMLMHSEQLPKNEDAISYLQHMAPDLGKSCWINRGLDYENRSFLLSVIVPAYNVEETIISCLESILQQDVSFDYEVIVVNDGSTDTTAVLIERYRNNERVCVINQENRGLSAARNAGIACSKGEYLCFVDSDDELADGALECLMSKALKERAKLVVGSYEKCLRNGIVIYTKQMKDQKAEGGTLPGFAHGKVIHYSVFRNLRFPEGYWFEDSIMAQIVHPLCHEATYTTSQICYKYYSNEKGITMTANGNEKSIDSLWVTMRLLKERENFHLSYTQSSYEHFLSMVGLTYHRTKYLDIYTAQCIFVVQRMLMEHYFRDYKTVASSKKQQIEIALRTNNFRKYVFACGLKH